MKKAPPARMGKDARGIWLLSAPVDFRDVTSDLGKRMAVENGGVHDVLHAVNEPFFISIVPQKIREIFVSGVIRV